MRPSRKALQQYLRERWGARRLLETRPLGKGVHGEGFLLKLEGPDGRPQEMVLKAVRPRGLGHDYPSDRAALLLLAHSAYNALEGHVRAYDVLGLWPGGQVRSVGGAREFYLLMQRAQGRSYFQDLRAMAGMKRLDGSQRQKLAMMVQYLARIHSVKKRSRELYVRRIRDVVGHGECLMGVFDAYPSGAVRPREMVAVEQALIPWRYRLKGRWQRLCQVHGDFHPGNIWFRGRGRTLQMTLLDRSRGPWGEAADDLTALGINYIFFSLLGGQEVQGAYLEAFLRLFDQYVRLSADEELLQVLAPFFVFRAAVVANPRFYPELRAPGRRALFAFMHRVLAEERFEPQRVNEYLKA